MNNCKWCGSEFPAKDGKKFCTTHHKNLFNSAARKWGLQAAHAGLVSVDELKRFAATHGPCTAIDEHLLTK